MTQAFTLDARGHATVAGAGFVLDPVKKVVAKKVVAKKAPVKKAVAAK